MVLFLAGMRQQLPPAKAFNYHCVFFTPIPIRRAVRPASFPHAVTAQMQHFFSTTRAYALKSVLEPTTSNPFLSHLETYPNFLRNHEA